jgi:hypothetical protein
MTRSEAGPLAARHPRAKVTLDGLAIWGCLFVLAALMFSGVALSRYSRDESQWIYTTRYLTLFRRADFTSPEWHNYWTQTQPPLARYVMGLSLKAASFDPLKLNGPWDFTKEDDENASLGNMPTPETLFWARLPISLFAAGAVAVLYLIGRQVVGVAGGLAAAAWLALNPRSRELMTRAESEGLFICLLLLVLWLTFRLVSECEWSQRRGARWARPLLLTVTIGVLCGLAASAKLTGLVALVAVWLALLCDAGVRWLGEARHAPAVRRNALLRRLLAAFATIVGTGSLALLTFVLLNPALYARPFQGPAQLLEYRQAEMQDQMALYPTAALNTPLERLGAAARRPLFTYGTINGLIKSATDEGNSLGEWSPLDAVLVATGLAATAATLTRGAVRTHKNAGSKLWWYVDPGVHHPAAPGVGPRGIALIFTAVFFGAIAASMGLDWDRYVLPLMVLASLWAGVGISLAWRRIAGLRTG